MYSSSSSFNPFQYTSQTSITTSFLDTHQNPNSLQENPFSSFSPFFNFPDEGPFLDGGDLLLNEFLTKHHHQQQQRSLGLNEIAFVAAEETNNQEEDDDGDDQVNPAASKKTITTRNNSTKKKRSNTNASSSKQTIPRKRSGKRDRHSKIYTAQGPRDRRMRLSLQIARKFFDLQDMLGFDKASKTIDWLFTKSKAAIKELTDSFPKVKRISNNNDGGSRSVSSTSESSEVMSGIKLTTDNNGDKRSMGLGTENDSFLRQKKCKMSNNTLNLLLARESRDKARARARERTKEKLKFKDLDKSNPNNLDQLVSSSSLRNGENQEMIDGQEEEEEEEEQEAEDQDCNTYFQLPDQMDSISIVDKLLGFSSETKSSSGFDLIIPSGPDFENHEFSGFISNWDIFNERPFNMKHLRTGNLHLQDPNSIFMTPTSSNLQEQNLTTDFIDTLDTQDENPSSVFVNFSNSKDQNPSSIPISIDAAFQSLLTEEHFSCNPVNAANKYGSLY